MLGVPPEGGILRCARAVRGAPKRIEEMSATEERGCCACGAAFLSLLLWGRMPAPARTQSVRGNELSVEDR